MRAKSNRFQLQWTLLFLIGLASGFGPGWASARAEGKDEKSGVTSADPESRPGAPLALQNLAVRFSFHQQSYERFEAEKQRRTGDDAASRERLAEEILDAHDRGLFRHAITLAHSGEFLSDRREAQSLNTMALMALGSAYFHERSFRSSAQICNTVAEALQRWSASAQVRTFANQCAYAVLKSLVTWGRRLDGRRDFAAFLWHPGFQQPVWQQSLAPRLVEVARRVSEVLGVQAQGQVAAADLNVAPQKVTIGSSVPDSSAGTFSSDAAFVSGVLAIELEDPARALDLLAPLVNGRDPLKAAMAQWLTARVQTDLGRGPQGVLAHEAAAELLISEIKSHVFAVGVHEIAIGLMARMVFDSTHVLIQSGAPERAQSIVTELAAVVSQLRKDRPEMSWLAALEDAAWLERARIAAQTQTIPSLVTLTSAKETFLRSLKELGALSARAQSRRNRDATAEDGNLESIARQLGLRSRSLDALVVGGRRLAHLDAELEALKVSQTLILLESAAREPEHHDMVLWMGTTHRYFNEFTDQAIALVEDIQRALQDGGKSDSAWEFSQRADAQVAAGIEISRTEREDFLAQVSPFGWRSAGTTQPIRGILGALPGRVSSPGESRPRDWERLAAQGHRAFTEGLIGGQSARTLVGAQRILLRVASLTEKAIARSQRHLPKRHHAFVTRAMGALRGMQDSLNLMERMAAFEQSRSLSWNAQMQDPKSALQSRLALARRQRASLAETLSRLSQGNRSAVAKELRELIERRESALKESMLLAYAAGSMASEKLEFQLQELDQQVAAAARVIEEAAAQGNLR